MDREFYQWLQTLIFALQLPDWPYSFSQQNAIVLITNSLDLDPNDPELLSKALVKLSQVLIGEEEIESIPSNLKDLVRDYEEHLEEIRENSLKEVFKIDPDKEVDEWIKKLYQNYRQKIQNQIVEPEKELAANPKLREGVAHQITLNLIKALPSTAREEGPGSLSKEDYEKTFEALKPLIIQDLKWAGAEEPKIKTDENIIKNTVTTTIGEAKKTAFSGRNVVPAEKLLTPLKKPVTKPIIKRAETAPAVTPELPDLPFLKWQPSGIKVSPFRTGWAFSKRAMLSPFVKPLQWLIDLAPEDIRKKYLTLTYTSKGFTPQAVDQTLKYLYKEKPESPEIPYWQNLKAIFKSERPSYLTLFEHYHESKRLGQVITRTKTLGTSRLARMITFGRFDNFPSLRASFWRFFKGTRIGGLLSRGAGKIIVGLGKLTSALSGIGTAILAWDTFKKAMKAAGAYLFGLLMIAAHYGAAAVTGSLLGALGGGIAGGVIGYKIGGLIGAAIGGPIGIIIGGTIGFIVGLFAQFIWDKITAAISGVSLPQAGTAGLTKASAAASSTASLAMPAAAATAVVGGLIVSQVISSAFVIPSEEVMLTSPYIEVTKTVEFSGNIGDPIRYTIRVTAIDKDLTNIKIVDQPTATCRGSPPDLSEHSWDGSLSIPEGGVWEKDYTVNTNNQFNDCLISNTVRVTALVDGKTEESFSVGHVSIGNPPETIPQGLPIHDNPQRGTGYTFGQVTEEGIIHQGIDVHGPEGATVYSTFTSESTVTDVGYSARGGYYIILSSGKYQAYMGHLAKRPALKVGDTVGPMAPVGIQGDSGHSFGEHVHYQIWENGVIVDPRNFGVPSPPW